MTCGLIVNSMSTKFSLRNNFSTPLLGLNVFRFAVLLSEIYPYVIGSSARRMTVGIKPTIISGNSFFISHQCKYVVDMFLHMNWSTHELSTPEGDKLRLINAHYFKVGAKR